MKKKVDLQTAIKTFAKRHHEFSTSNGAKDQCAAATESFLDYLDVLGLTDQYLAEKHDFNVLTKNAKQIDRIPYLVGFDKGEDLSDHHCVVKTKDVFIDFTARQYNPELPFPYIIPRRRQRR